MNDMYQNGHKSKILLIEDDAYSEKLALNALLDHCREVEIGVVRDGSEALDYIFVEAHFASVRLTTSQNLFY